MPTHDEALDGLLTEPHNNGDGWQGHFRRGHPDAVLLRYALEAAGNLSGLLISHLDVFQRGILLKWCEHYSAVPPLAQAPQLVERLPLGIGEDFTHQRTLTHLLQSAHPQYHAEPIHSAPSFMDRIADVTSLPVILRSYGPTCADVLEKQVPTRLASVALRNGGDRQQI